ncbi:hypothetical protein P280DRAFT_478180 [Massarina eburnea CBS 473.64]|uniref:Uncharacterized protein n=1 Tax=Massarina eburnea CBS 473.64 TaxID=1395130 RepID=A0A6A6S857_9PLEO|nr:hypothetical protein P280DRAFT_478180 [Massarina eburnea CBS 473.64]
MTTAMSQQGLELPSSRQDIVSALLNDYGSFDDDDASLYSVYSPAAAPPKTPERERESSDRKSIPYEDRFQLRVVDEPASPDSPDSSYSSTDSQTSRIKYRSISRDSKPPSLSLFASNGSTAKVPPSSVPSSGTLNRVTSLPRTPRGEEAAGSQKSLPPPPPEKLARRQQQQQETPMGNQVSVNRLPRKDSLQSQERNNMDEAAEPVKRKPIPSKIMSLLDLKNRPRGGKGGPMPVPRSRNESMDRPLTAVEAKFKDSLELSENVLTKSRTNEDAMSQKIPPVPVMGSLPPTPTSDGHVTSKKTFAGTGLPSNPRAKHMKGKSSTGFKWVGGAKAAPAPNTITPGPSPSPQEGDQHRPFSLKPASSAPTTDVPSNPIADSAATTSPYPPPSTIRSPAGLPSQQPQPGSPVSLSSPEDPSVSEGDQAEALDVSTPLTPVFTPMTMQPAPTAAAPITNKHLTCYTKHKHYVWSKNDFQPMACMVCKSNERERKWACTWCYLRICLGCAGELRKIEGKDVKNLLEKKGINLEMAMSVDGPRGRDRVRSMEIAQRPNRHDSGTVPSNGAAGNPSVVVWNADEKGYRGENDFA